MKPPYRKSWAGNLLMWSDLTLSPSFKIIRGQPSLKGFITHLLLILEVCNVKPTCRILWAGNLPMSDLTFGPSFQVKRWLTGFGELSFRWIQICIGSPMCRSSLFSSPPRPQPLCFESLSLRTAQIVPPTPGTALQNKIESKLEKSPSNQFNIQLQQQMRVFQASMLEAMKSLRVEMQSMKKASEAEVDKTSTALSKAGPSKQPDPTTQVSDPTTRMLNLWT